MGSEPSLLDAISRACATFDATYGARFVSVGIGMFKAFAITLLAWTGIEIALSGHFDASKLVRTIFFISFGWFLCFGYSTPIPGIGNSLTGLITDQVSWIDGEISKDTIVQMFGEINALRGSRPVGSGMDPNSYFVEWTVIIAYTLMTLVVYVVMAYGMVAAKVCLLLGPFFVPWFIVPRMDWLFWGWLKAFLGYSFYQVVASATVFIVAGAWLQVMRTISVGLKTGDVAYAYSHLSVLVIYSLGCALLMLKVPQMASSLFTGAAGGDGGMVGFIQGAAQKGAAAASAAVL